MFPISKANDDAPTEFSSYLKVNNKQRTAANNWQINVILIVKTYDIFSVRNKQTLKFLFTLLLSSSRRCD